MKDTTHSYPNGSNSWSTSFGSLSTRSEKFRKRFMRRLMSLRVKTTTVLVFLFLVMFCAFAIVIVSVFAKSFSKLEVSKANNVSQRLIRNLYDDLESLLATALPIAAWDDTMQLLDDFNYSNNMTQAQTFSVDNLGDAFMKVIRVDYALFYARNGTLLFHSSYDSIDSTPLTPPSELQHLDINHPLLKGVEDITTRSGGYINCSDDILMISCAPIQAGAMVGNSYGLFCMATILRELQLQNIASRNRFCITMQPYNHSSPMWSHVQKGNHRVSSVSVTTPEWKNSSPSYIGVLKSGKELNRVCSEGMEEQLSVNRIAAYNIVSDVFGKPVAIWRADIERDIYKLSVKSILLAFGSLVLIGILVSVSFILFIERAVISRTLRLIKEVKSIAKTMNVGQRVVLKGRDELGNMAKQVNLLLDGIEGLQKGVKEEKEKSERLVFNMLPEVIYERLKEAKKVDESTLTSDSGADHVKTESESIISRMLIADTISEVSVLFSDMSGLYNFNAESTEMVRLLNTIFSGFDHVCSQVGVEKIKTIGNVFMAVAGAPVQVSDHAERAVKQALGMYNVTKIIGEQLGLSIGIRIGINSGPIVAGVVGTTKYVYDIFGDTVNVASRMQSHGLTGHLHISETTHTSLNGKFPFEERGMTDIKGKGKMKTYLLDLEAIGADSEAQKKAIPIFKRKVEEPRSSFYKNKIFPM